MFIRSRFLSSSYPLTFLVHMFANVYTHPIYCNFQKNIFREKINILIKYNWSYKTYKHVFESKGLTPPLPRNARKI